MLQYTLVIGPPTLVGGGPSAEEDPAESKSRKSVNRMGLAINCSVVQVT